MTHVPILEEIAIMGFLAVLVSVVLQRLHLPVVAGFLLSGALIGPFGAGLVEDTHSIEVIAEVGVVLLLFTIGLEFSLEQLHHIFRRVALGGVLQVVLTGGLVTFGALVAKFPVGVALFYGFVFALSSTAIVLRALTERRELDAPHGRFIVGTLIFQDLCVVPMVLVVPLLVPGGAGFPYGALGLALGKAALVVVLVLGSARSVVPRVLDWVEASRSREVFLLAVVSLCVGTAWLTSLAGLSLALGAFLGGMVVADTEYRHRAMGDLIPLRDVFVSIFFISLGMFFDLRVVLGAPVQVALLLAGFVLAKGFLATIAALVMRFPPRAAWLAGVGLAQFGEFGFVLVKLGLESGVVEPAAVQPLLCAGIMSMFLTPILVRLAPQFTAGERLLAPLARLLGARGSENLETEEEELEDHVVVIGYGIAGRMVSGSLRRLRCRVVILELNAESVRRGRKAGDPVYYGDATSREVLGHVAVARARCVVVLINDPAAAQRVVDTLRQVAPDTPVLTRCHYLVDCEQLLELGATSVAAEEVEGGVEVLARTLRELELPRNVIDAEVAHARQGSGGSARTPTIPRPHWGGATALSRVKIEKVSVVPESEAVGRSLRDLDLRARTGALVVALERDAELRPHPDPSERLREGDVAFLLGEGPAVEEAVALLGSAGAPVEPEERPAEPQG